MRISPFKKTNHRAVAGFLMPFAAAGLTGGLLLLVEDGAMSLAFLIPYLSVVPLALICGLILSIQSIPLIEELNDKDFAYSGLTLNLLFLTLYVISLWVYINGQ